ncbi:hypothetical protein BWP39_26080 [Paraburkholderia acidicola]|uniref:DUF4148 domain-containing protein n=1 Tax=Paraburkholderia acidicola TaxID=1912599 RepID=A0A2A4ER41_9BURK|nr:DUF4148 domain-containing protein [Paraburkholderia acidicola]PCE23157.1 hypothetical protein BWP39_26080 [Paraburkholderia acidicola]
MKVSTIALALAVCASATSVSAATSADATTTASNDTHLTQQWTPVQAAAQGKTRAQVRQELALAQKDGELESLKQVYHGS